MRLGLVLTLCLLTSLPTFASVKKEVEVLYELNGQTHRVSGKAIPHGYRFEGNTPKALKIATLDWPPYIGRDLCNHGWVFQLGLSVLLSQGFSVEIYFYPWARAVRETEMGYVDILFPEYYIEPGAPSDVHKNTKRLDHLILSRPFPGGDLSFVKRTETSIAFTGNLTALIGEFIGVVRGYQNTPEFDRMMDAGQFNIIEAVDDLQLVKILMARRVNLVLGDPNVLFYTLKHSDLPLEKKEKYLKQMEQVNPPLEYKYLFFAVSKKRPDYDNTLLTINQSLLLFQQTGDLQTLIDRAKQACLID